MSTRTGGLTERQKRFVEEYLIDLNATQAAIRTGYSENTAQEQGSRLLSNAMVASAIAAAQSRRSRRTEVTQDRVIQELAAVAFGTLDDVAPWDESGPRLIPSEQLPREKKAMIASIKVKRRREYKGRGEDQEAWEVEEMQITPNDKLRALDALARHLGMYNDKLQLNVSVDDEDVRAAAKAAGLDPEEIVSALEQEFANLRAGQA